MLIKIPTIEDYCYFQFLKNLWWIQFLKKDPLSFVPQKFFHRDAYNQLLFTLMVDLELCTLYHRLLIYLSDWNTSSSLTLDYKSWYYAELKPKIIVVCMFPIDTNYQIIHLIHIYILKPVKIIEKLIKSLFLIWISSINKYMP